MVKAFRPSAADENTERTMLSLSELELGVAYRILPITSVQPTWFEALDSP